MLISKFFFLINQPPPVCITITISEWNIDLNLSEWNILLELGCDGVPSQGETFRVTGTLIDLDGNIVTNLSGATHSIRTYNPSGTLVTTETTPTYTGAGGIWTQNFTPAADAPIGGWRVFWIVTLAGTVGVAKLPFWVSDP